MVGIAPGRKFGLQLRHQFDRTVVTCEPLCSLAAVPHSLPILAVQGEMIKLKGSILSAAVGHRNSEGFPAALRDSRRCRHCLTRGSDTEVREQVQVLRQAHKRGTTGCQPKRKEEVGDVPQQQERGGGGAEFSVLEQEGAPARGDAASAAPRGGKTQWQGAAGCCAASAFCKSRPFVALRVLVSL